MTKMWPGDDLLWCQTCQDMTGHRMNPNAPGYGWCCMDCGGGPGQSGYEGNAIALLQRWNLLEDAFNTLKARYDRARKQAPKRP